LITEFYNVHITQLLSQYATVSMETSPSVHDVNGQDLTQHLEYSLWIERNYF